MKISHQMKLANMTCDVLLLLSVFALQHHEALAWASSARLRKACLSKP